MFPDLLLELSNFCIVLFQKISILPPGTEGNWNFLAGGGGWVFFSKTKAFKEMNQP